MALEVASEKNGGTVESDHHDSFEIEKESSTATGKIENHVNAYSEMIPQDLLFALTEVNSLLKAKEEELGPVKTLKTPKEMRVPLGKGAPDGVWHHRNRRLMYHHLTKHPKSDGKTAGSKDISFLYDVSATMKQAPQTPSRFDKSASRMRALHEKKSSPSNLTIPDSIIPDEYHIVKSKAVIGLDYADEKMTTNLIDQEKALRIFPSLTPTKRFEVVQLMKTMDQMLSKAGVDDLENEVKGPTQIHNLLEIIKKEQQIYDLVFHEIPRQIKSLHSEVMAQRSLDRRLTDELMRFKGSIGNLTSELIAVREHDKKITQEAEIAQVDLAQALKESQKNANLVDEYHDLYELQRNRLENQVSVLTYERDLWCNASYSLALKIILENSLSTAKRLHVTEKAWYKLAVHFNVMISDHDTESLVELQNHVEVWRDVLFSFNQVLEGADKKTVDVLTKIRNAMRHRISVFEDTMIGYYEDTDIRTIKLPSTEFIESLQADVCKWESIIGDDSERFGGDVLLSNQELLIKLAKEVEAWTDVGITIYERHRLDNGESYQQYSVMNNNSDRFHVLKKQMDVRITGENVISDGEWLKFYDLLSDYEALLGEIINSVSSIRKEGQNNMDEDRVTVEEMISDVQKWLKDTLNGIEGENGKMSAQISTIHTQMVHWMVQMLLFLAPDKDNLIPSESSLSAGCSLEELTKKCLDLSDHLSRVTAYLCQCVGAVVETTTQKKKDAGDDDADHEMRDFLRVKSECKEWIRTCQLLLNTKLEKPITLLDEAMQTRLDVGKFMVKKEAIEKPNNDKKTEIIVEEEPKPILAQQDTANQLSTDLNVTDSQDIKKPVTDDLTQSVESKEEMVPATELTQRRMTQYEIIGADENVEAAVLEDAERENRTESSRGTLTPPSSDLTRQAYDTIAKMDQFQEQLLRTEERAQQAEEKTVELEEYLKAANEKIRALERKISEAEKTSNDTAPIPTVQEPADTKPSTSDKLRSESPAKPLTPETGKRSSSRAGIEKKKGRSKKK